MRLDVTLVTPTCSSLPYFQAAKHEGRRQPRFSSPVSAEEMKGRLNFTSEGTIIVTAPSDTATSSRLKFKTNLPKEVMGFPDFPIPNMEVSYVESKDILDLINDYADHFKLRQFIKFHTQVQRVHPLESGGWEVTVRDVVNKTDFTEKFDAVMVCNGHYWKPYIPKLDGTASFSGEQIHSHDYRSPERFRGKRVLVLGAGPSGMDVTLHISSAAQQVIMSHRNSNVSTKFPSNVTQKPHVTRITKYGAEFADGSSAAVDVIMYCTGFLYDFHFLSEDCGVRVEDNHVQPLFKHLIHMDHPTMCFIGLPFYVCAFLLFDLQVRFFLRVLDGHLILPSRQDMQFDMEHDQEVRKARGLSQRQAHMMGTIQNIYYDELADLAGLPRIPPVMADLHNESSSRFEEDLTNFRQDIYRIVDDRTFVQIK